MTNQETITDDASPDDEAEQGWLRVLDRIKKLRTAIDGLADEVEEVSQRTAARYRALGLPFLTFGGWIWIPKREGREWIASRVKRRNPRRQRRQAIPASLNIIAPRAPP
ncbi:MAG TPA: hypothetical protein VM910_34845 [Bradyrhizobium sp.]|nr:hypothetical protein [Bradyrhizobium sp.]